MPTYTIKLGNPIPEQKYCTPEYDLEECSISYAVREVLNAWHLQHHLPQFLSPQGLVIALHLCNAGAKFIDPWLYELKPTLIIAAIEKYPFVWAKHGIVYFETDFGQLSFHVFDGEDSLAPCRPNNEWSGGWMQDNAYGIAMEFLGGSEESSYYYDRWLDCEQCG